MRESADHWNLTNDMIDLLVLHACVFYFRITERRTSHFNQCFSDRLPLSLEYLLPSILSLIRNGDSEALIRSTTKDRNSHNRSVSIRIMIRLLNNHRILHARQIRKIKLRLRLMPKHNSKRISKVSLEVGILVPCRRNNESALELGFSLI